MTWQIEFPAERAGQPALRFQGRPAACPVPEPGTRRTLYALDAVGRLVRLVERTTGWSLEVVALPGAAAALRFLPGVRVLQDPADPVGASILLVATDGRLVRVRRDGTWRVDFPADPSFALSLRFQAGLAGFVHDGGRHRITVLGVTTDGRVAQLREEDAWALSFPAESAGIPEYRFAAGLDAFATDAAAGRAAVYAVTTDGRLAQVWKESAWRVDFPAALAGHADVHFAAPAAVLPRDRTRNKKSLHALTRDGRLVQLWDDGSWHLDFPAEVRGDTDRFDGGVACLSTDVPANQKALFCVDAGGQLSEFWDTKGWFRGAPADEAGKSGLRFASGSVDAGTDGRARWLAAVTGDGRLAWLTDRFVLRLGFTVEAQCGANWCWCAVAVSLVRYHDKMSSLTQCRLATEMLHTDCETDPVIRAASDARAPARSDWVVPWPVDPAWSARCDATCYPEEAVKHVGLDGGSRVGVASLAELEAQFKAGHPVVLKLADEYDVHHVVVVHGATADGVIAVADPLHGPSEQPYETLRSGYPSAGWRWTVTLFTTA